MPLSSAATRECIPEVLRFSIGKTTEDTNENEATFRDVDEKWSLECNSEANKKDSESGVPRMEHLHFLL